MPIIRLPIALTSITPENYIATSHTELISFIIVISTAFHYNPNNITTAKRWKIGFGWKSVR